MERAAEAILDRSRHTLRSRNLAFARTPTCKTDEELHRLHPGRHRIWRGGCTSTGKKRLKKWNRAWKVDLIEQADPQWHDLHATLNQ